MKAQQHQVRSPPTRAHIPFLPSWQRFHEFAAPKESSNSGGDAATTPAASQHHPYARQYSHIYAARLAALRDRCVSNAQRTLDVSSSSSENVGSAEVVEQIIEVKEGVWSVLVGTIVKEMDPKRRPLVNSSYGSCDTQSFLFPSVNGSDKEPAQESLRSYLFDSEKGDVLHLEDSSGRVEIAPMEIGDDREEHNFALDPNRVATGVVAAVIGKVSVEKGVMYVHSVHFAGPPVDALKLDRASNKQTSHEPTLLIISGLGCGADSPTDVSSGGSLALRREMLLEYLTQPKIGNGASFCRMIVAGGGVASPNQLERGNGEISNGGKTTKGNSHDDSGKSKSVNASRSSKLAESLRDLDIFFSEVLSSGIPVDYIPGWHDPTNANWPQRPIHSCLLPHSCSFVDLFGRSTNPFEGILSVGDDENANMRVLGSDGLNIADLRRFLAMSSSSKIEQNNNVTNGDSTSVEGTSSMDALHQTFRYGHMAPTGPDSLPTFPSSESDPFVMQTRPGIYFAGNCEKFETRLVDVNGDEVDEVDEANAMAVEGEQPVTRLVCVPRFAESGEVVLVKLNTLECEVVSFCDVRA
mmetsp:Transcript_18437/g.36618  ORF Transcript_18437/g.36618 Transcript_18437/m.36618 type:complete len:581 (+) Transcript_18437:105-1847(+)